MKPTTKPLPNGQYLAILVDEDGVVQWEAEHEHASEDAARAFAAEAAAFFG